MFATVISSTYEGTALTAAAVTSYLEWFWRPSLRFGNVRKAFLPLLRGKRIAIILWFLGRRKSKLVQKIAQVVSPWFHTQKKLKYKRPKCPFYIISLRNNRDVFIKEILLIFFINAIAKPHLQCTLIRSQCVQYLGLCFDEKITWTEHINNLSLQ